jgi:hypothetical protein
MAEYRVFTCEDLLPASVPEAAYGEDDWAEAVEHAARIKGYVVLRTAIRDYVAWVAPKLDVYRMSAAMVRAWQPHLKDTLGFRCAEIRAHLHAHRMSEVA